jgi:hypothetical protein
MFKLGFMIFEPGVDVIVFFIYNGQTPDPLSCECVINDWVWSTWRSRSNSLDSRDLPVFKAPGMTIMCQPGYSLC